MELFRKGASTPAALTFLLASPWASLSLTLVILSLFRLQGLVLVVCSLAIAFVTGVILQRLAARGALEPNPHTIQLAEPCSIRRDFAQRVRAYPWTLSQLAHDARGILAGAIPLGRMVLGWFQLGLVLSALIGGLVPHAFFERILGPSAAGLAATIGLAAVVEVCSEGTAPLAFELYRQTGALGNAFAFLMGGVVTDVTEVGTVWRAMGRRSACWLLGISLSLVIGVAILLNLWRVRG
jgi:uncharacterized membrane protein YraQ (UPF0718 family)